jgi:hypothetical protein
MLPRCQRKLNNKSFVTLTTERRKFPPIFDVFERNEESHEVRIHLGRSRLQSGKRLHFLSLSPDYKMTHAENDFGTGQIIGSVHAFIPELGTPSDGEGSVRLTSLY